MGHATDVALAFWRDHCVVILSLHQTISQNFYIVTIPCWKKHCHSCCQHSLITFFSMSNVLCLYFNICFFSIWYIKELVDLRKPEYKVLYEVNREYMDNALPKTQCRSLQTSNNNWDINIFLFGYMGMGISIVVHWRWCCDRSFNCCVGEYLARSYNF